MPCIFIYLMDTVWWSLSIHSFWYIEPLNCWSKYLSKTINPAPLVWQCHYVIANTEKQQFGKSWNCMRYHKQSRENFKCLWQFYVDHSYKVLAHPGILVSSRDWETIHEYWDMIMRLPDLKNSHIPWSTMVDSVMPLKDIRFQPCNL